ncbi:MAG: TraB/GumN family protein, partial [Pseudomonadales bacterium]|nr:TraB/GumN family protein [Pseudomonadales bacterium]
LVLIALAFISLRAFCAGPETEKLCLWRVQHSAATVYLLGSVHVMMPGDYPLPATIEAAFGDADTVVVEVDMDQVDPAEMTALTRELGFFGPDQQLVDVLSASTNAKLKDYLTTEGLPPDRFEQMRPWLVSITLGASALSALGFSDEYGIDEHFLRAARRDGKRVAQLETFREQIQLLASDPLPVQDVALRATLDELDGMKEEVDELMAAWRAGDADRMYSLSMAPVDEYPELEDQMRRLIDERNKKMAEKIRGYLGREGTWMVIVGALHMGGEHGILRLLSQDFTITQLSR